MAEALAARGRVWGEHNAAALQAMRDELRDRTNHRPVFNRPVIRAVVEVGYCNYFSSGWFTSIPGAP